MHIGWHRSQWWSIVHIWWHRSQVWPKTKLPPLVSLWALIRSDLGSFKSSNYKTGHKLLFFKRFLNVFWRCLFKINAVELARKQIFINLMKVVYVYWFVTFCKAGWKIKNGGPVHEIALLHSWCPICIGLCKLVVPNELVLLPPLVYLREKSLSNFERWITIDNNNPIDLLT